MATLPLQLPAPAPPWVVHSTGRGAESPLAADAAERDDFERRMQVAWPWVVRLVDRLLGWPERASDVEDGLVLTGERGVFTVLADCGGTDGQGPVSEHRDGLIEVITHLYTHRQTYMT